MSIDHLFLRLLGPICRKKTCSLVVRKIEKLRFGNCDLPNSLPGDNIFHFLRGELSAQSLDEQNEISYLFLVIHCKLQAFYESISELRRLLLGGLAAT